MDPTREALLSAIRSEPVAEPALADRLGISPDAVSDHVVALRAAGFEIAGDEQYELVALPSFGREAVEFGLEAPFDVEYHGTIGSTNDRARDLAAAGADDVVVLADEQTGGRGRRGRQWTSPSGGIWLSILHRPDLEAAVAPRYTLAAAVATARAVRDVGVAARIKWPNDVLVDGRKLAGILTESAGSDGGLEWQVVGIGLNANVDPSAVPGDVAATSLAAECGDTVDRRRVVQHLLETFEDLRTEPAEILPAWREDAATLGRDVRVETPDGPVEGRAADVTDVGALVVETDEGRVTVSAGDCEHLRPRGG